MKRILFIILAGLLLISTASSQLQVKIGENVHRDRHHVVYHRYHRHYRHVRVHGQININTTKHNNEHRGNKR